MRAESSPVSLPKQPNYHIQHTQNRDFRERRRRASVGLSHFSGTQFVGAAREEEKDEEMPAQKRASDEDDSSPGSPAVKEEEEDDEGDEGEAEGGEGAGGGGGGGGGGEAEVEAEEEVEEKEAERHDSEGSPSSSSGDKDEFVLVKLSDIRKEVQCPICLGIIRKTRTVMECLHRFCRECIDKSMRLGNNECPACRTHCASRRSLRDDPNYDALIAAIYPDIDKYEEEIQASIAQTLRRQSEALARRRNTAKATAAAFARKAHGNYRSGHGQNSYLRGKGKNNHETGNTAASDDEDEDDANGNEGAKDSSSADDPSPDFRQKRIKRWTGQSRSSPMRSSLNADAACDENDELEVSRESTGASPGLGGNPEVLVWGGGGIRSHTRYGSVSGSNGKFSRCSRMSKLMDYLVNRSSEENDDGVYI
ncbi:putative E3 ubiquitin-protein ligase [Nymphaea thermarum]|nr:putative E3 ubiquitin-protein ligase [Nymphaea thermarum]